VVAIADYGGMVKTAAGGSARQRGRCRAGPKQGRRRRSGCVGEPSGPLLAPACRKLEAIRPPCAARSDPGIGGALGRAWIHASRTIHGAHSLDLPFRQPRHLPRGDCLCRAGTGARAGAVHDGRAAAHRRMERDPSQVESDQMALRAGWGGRARHLSRPSP